MSGQDGGPAFPVHERHAVLRDDRWRDEWLAVGGMSLRDYFAGQALIAFVKGYMRVADCRGTENEVADRCYEMADAMLKARQA